VRKGKAYYAFTRWRIPGKKGRWVLGKKRGAFFLFFCEGMGVWMSGGGGFAFCGGGGGGVGFGGGVFLRLS